MLNAARASWPCRRQQTVNTVESANPESESESTPATPSEQRFPVPRRAVGAGFSLGMGDVMIQHGWSTGGQRENHHVDDTSPVNPKLSR